MTDVAGLILFLSLENTRVTWLLQDLVDVILLFTAVCEMAAMLFSCDFDLIVLHFVQCYSVQ